MGRTLEIVYWKVSKLKGLDWIGNEVIKSDTKKEYRSKLWKILARIEDAGYNAMIMHHENFTSTVFIADGRFNQS